MLERFVMLKEKFMHKNMEKSEFKKLIEEVIREYQQTKWMIEDEK